MNIGVTTDMTLRFAFLYADKHNGGFSHAKLDNIQDNSHLFARPLPFQATDPDKLRQAIDEARAAERAPAIASARREISRGARFRAEGARARVPRLCELQRASEGAPQYTLGCLLPLSYFTGYSLAHHESSLNRPLDPVFHPH